MNESRCFSIIKELAIPSFICHSIYDFYSNCNDAIRAECNILN